MVELVQLLASGPSGLERCVWSAVDVAGRCSPALAARLGDPHRWMAPYTLAEVDAAVRQIKPCSYLENVVGQRLRTRVLPARLG